MVQPVKVLSARRWSCLAAIAIFAAAGVQAQSGDPDRAPGSGHGWDHGGGQPPPPMQGDHSPMGRGFHPQQPPGKWWTNPAIIQTLELTQDQQKRIDSIFQQSRLKLIDLSATVQKEETIMEPLLESEHPEEAKILLQIDRIAQARAELEKANARMLLGFRSVLNQDQWKKLQEQRPGPGPGSRPDGPRHP